MALQYSTRKQHTSFLYIDVLVQGNPLVIRRSAVLFKAMMHKILLFLLSLIGDMIPQKRLSKTLYCGPVAILSYFP